MCAHVMCVCVCDYVDALLFQYCVLVCAVGHSETNYLLMNIINRFATFLIVTHILPFMVNNTQVYL